jgi:hypothetical protein
MTLRGGGVEYSTPQREEWDARAHPRFNHYDFEQGFYPTPQDQPVGAFFVRGGVPPPLHPLTTIGIVVRYPFHRKAK